MKPPRRPDDRWRGQRARECDGERPWERDSKRRRECGAPGLDGGREGECEGGEFDGGREDELEVPLGPVRKAKWEAGVDRLFRRFLWLLLTALGFIVGTTLSMEVGLAMCLAAVAFIARYPEMF